MYSALSTEKEIACAAKDYGAAPGSRAILLGETKAAEESIRTGLYITWQPAPGAKIGASAANDVRNGTGQCCRIGSSSICSCGHLLLDHIAPISLAAATTQGRKSIGYIRPPLCKQCGRCSGFAYAPSRPEECGQWWLPRRKDFNLKAWQQRVCSAPQDYCCIGCDASVAEHETIFEVREDRLRRGALVDNAYLPLESNSELRAAALQQRVLNPKAKRRNDTSSKSDQAKLS